MDEKQCRIVLIDDDAVDRFIVKRSLQIFGLHCTMIEFEKPEEAIEFLSNPGERVKMIITDMRMENIDGYQIIASIREFTHHQLTPIVAITSFNPDFDEALSILYGANYFYTKPLSGAAIQKISFIANQK